MQQGQPTYAQLLETNTLIRHLADESVWLCRTRTVQESKLFPVSPYMLLSYLMAFYRYPTLLRKIEAQMPAEEIGDRARNMGIKITNPPMGWGMPCFYLLGRELMLNMGLLRPQDALHDVVYVLDFWKRYQLSYHRNNGHLTNSHAGHRGQILPERRIQVFHADAFECRACDPLHTAATEFLAATSQYGFLISCESRVSLSNHGPYKVADNREMMVRDFMDLAESDFPWLDDIGSDIPFNNFTVPTIVEGCHIYLLDDWGSFESEPEMRARHLVGVGLYTSDPLSEGYVPVGMDSAEELTQTFTGLTEKIKQATRKLWERIAGWSRDQMIDAGAVVYYAIVKDLAHVAGVYEMEDWMLVDERAERFRPLFNDEYANACLGELVGTLTHPSQRTNDYVLGQHTDEPRTMFTPLPYSVLQGEDYVPTSGGLAPGDSTLPRKNDRYTTTQGVLSLDEYNERARAFTPELCDDTNRFLCETWVKYNSAAPKADALYELEQSRSRLLKDKGASLRRSDINALRADAPSNGGGG